LNSKFNYYFVPMEHLELVDRVYLAVKRMILEQELLPGQKLVQEKLAAELGVSRSPLLKALQRLESELLVEQIPRRGMYVKQLVPTEIRDIFACRAVIEGLSARLTARHATPDQINDLRVCFTPFVGIADIDQEAYARADRKFHQLVMAFSQNAVVSRLELLTNIHLTAFQAGLLRPPATTLPEHMAIIEAIAARDGTTAERLMRQHIEDSGQQIEA
ncbi:MAG: GntR family transcriptional regulator, partial [Bacteroidota bacterium]